MMCYCRVQTLHCIMFVHGLKGNLSQFLSLKNISVQLLQYFLVLPLTKCIDKKRSDCIILYSSDMIVITHWLLHGNTSISLVSECIQHAMDNTLQNRYMNFFLYKSKIQWNKWYQTSKKIYFNLKWQINLILHRDYELIFELNDFYKVSYITSVSA